MNYMVCRNHVQSYEHWRKIFDSHAAAHAEAELKLVHVWRKTKHPNDVFFVFEIGDMEKASAFINAPTAEDAGVDSGVIDGEYHFVESAELY